MFYINVLLGIVRAINWTVVTSDSTISLPIALSHWFCRSVVKGMCLLYTLYINFIDSLVLRLREKFDWWLSRWIFLFSKQCTQIASCVWKCIYACIIIFIKKIYDDHLSTQDTHERAWLWQIERERFLIKVYVFTRINIMHPGINWRFFD